MKKLIVTIATAILISMLTACSGTVTGVENTASSSPKTTTKTTSAVTTTTIDKTTAAATVVPVSVEYDDDDLNSGVSGAGISEITLKGNSIAFAGGGAIIDGNVVTITSAGDYSFSGSLDDGQIIVNARVSGTVRIILKGADIACSTTSPIYIKNAEKVVITLAEGTENSITDGALYVFEDEESDEPGAAIYSKSDLTINGNGSLVVNANYNNGIQCQDDLKITGGNITVNAVNEGIQGKDSVNVRDGNITIDADGDGIQSTKDGDEEKGYIAIEGGTLNITAGSDAIQAATNVLVSGGKLTLSSGGGSINSSSGAGWGNWGRQMVQPGMTGTATDSAGSAKGIKAAVDITITGGKINIDSSDDSINSNNSLAISGGNIVMASGDDGMHADAILVISGGDITIAKSYEGIESAAITVNDGTIYVTSSDDGFNAAGGADGSSVNGRPGQNDFMSAGSNTLTINGGYIYVDADGDGLDVNGPMTVTGGTILVNGPTNNGNGPLDYTGSFNMTGGYLVAAGSSGMAQAPSTTSTRYSVMINLSSALAAGTLFHIETAGGEDILTFLPAKSYQSVVFCSAALENGETYVVYSGGNVTGTATDGLYSGGEYSGGTEITTLTISGMVTKYGTSGGMGGGGMRR